MFVEDTTHYDDHSLYMFSVPQTFLFLLLLPSTAVSLIFLVHPRSFSLMNCLLAAPSVCLHDGLPVLLDDLSAFLMACLLS